MEPSYIIAFILGLIPVVYIYFKNKSLPKGTSIFETEDLDKTIKETQSRRKETAIFTFAFAALGVLLHSIDPFLGYIILFLALTYFFTYCDLSAELKSLELFKHLKNQTTEPVTGVE